MQTVTLKIEVLDSEVTQATEELKQLGYEAKKVEKATKDVGKTTKSSLDGVNDSANNLKGGVGGVGEEFVKVGKAAKAGGRAMKTALISTGVGALVVLVGELVANWDSIVASLDTQNKKIQEQHELLEISKDLLDAASERAKEERKLAELRGESTDALIEKERKLLKARIENRRETLLNTEAELKLAQERFKEITFFESLGQVFGIDARTQDDLDAIKKLKTAVSEAGTELAKVEQQLFKLDNPEEEKKAGADRVTKAAGVQDKGLESGIADPFNEQKAVDAARLQALQEGTEEFRLLQNEANLAEIDAFFQKEETKAMIDADAKEKEKQRENDLRVIREKILDKAAQKEIEIEQEKFAAKQALLDGFSGSLDAVSELVGRQTGAGKALAVASALIDTYAAIAAQLRAAAKSPGAVIPGYAIAQAVATGLAGFAAVKNILKVKVPYDQGGQGGSFSGGGGVSAPAFNVVGQSGVNQLAQSLNQEQQPIRAYVVGGDVTSQQEFDRNVQQTASI